MQIESIREFRPVAGQFNQMAVCAKCDRDASQVKFSRYCIDCLEDKPFTCDECVAG